MKKFKVGELVTGTSLSGYGITTDRALLKVVKIHKDYKRNLSVKLISHKRTCFNQQEYIGHTFRVNSNRFVKIPKLKRILLFGK